MKLQVLLSTRGQSDYTILDKMNIHSDALVINQGVDFSLEEVYHRGHTIQWMNLKEKGIGLSRNTALQRAEGDICLLADDDLVYEDEYADIVIKEFENHPQYDIIIFNLLSTNSNRPEFVIQKPHQVYLFNCLRYGAFRIGIRRDSFQRARIGISQMFGGGSVYGSGEDSLFLVDCLKKGLKIYASEKVLGIVEHNSSSWFSGFDRKYFYDKGALFAAMSERFWRFLCLQFCIRHSEMLTNFSLKEALEIMKEGANEYKERCL